MSSSHGRWLVAPTAIAIMLGTVVAGSAGASADLSFEAPVKLNESAWGFEPSIDVDAAGTLYVTAHKGSATNEGTRLSSFLWSSKDRGATWEELPSPADVHKALFSFEGDLAVDASNRMYFVDTYGPDTWLSTWTSGPAWERTAPAVTASFFDDRPWIAAHGDGIVYLITTDIGTHARPSDAAAAPPGSTTWAITPVLYRSADAGLTWSTVRAFNGAYYCGLAASPLDDFSLIVVCADSKHVSTYRSNDRGDHWIDQAIFTFVQGSVPMLSAAYDAGGNIYTAFVDAVPSGNKIYVARLAGGTWTVQDVTPFNGAFREVWTTARRTGEVGIGFYGSSDAMPGNSSDWYVYGGVSADAVSASPQWSIARADPQKVLTAFYPPPDFMQCIMGPDGTLYVAYSKETTSDLLHAPPPNFDHDILVARQAAGPNG